MFSKLAFNNIMMMITGKRFDDGKEEGMEEVKNFREIIREMLNLGGTSNLMDYLPILEWIDYGGYKKKLIVGTMGFGPDPPTNRPNQSTGPKLKPIEAQSTDPIILIYKTALNILPQPDGRYNAWV